jgi:hypothetical protein
MLGEVKIFCCHVQRFLRIEIGFDVLQHEGGFANAPSTHESYESVFPIDLLVGVSMKCGIGLRQQEIRGLKKAVHRRGFFTKLSKMHYKSAFLLKFCTTRVRFSCILHCDSANIAYLSASWE